MKIIKNLFLLILISLTLNSNAQRFKSALDLNDYIASITDTLYAVGSNWGNALNEVRISKDYAHLYYSRMDIENFIDAKLLELKNFHDQFGSEELKKAMISFLNVEKNMIVNSFRPFEKFTSTTSEDVVDKQIKALTDESEKEAVELKNVNAAQEEFGKRNNFTIEKVKDEK